MPPKLFQTQESEALLPYGKQSIDDADIQAVVDVLQSDWLTTGPVVDRFEKAIVQKIGCQAAVAVSSGTAALHATMNAIGIGPSDEVIVPAITFCATANAVIYEKGTPIFADVMAHTLLIDPDDVVKKITPKTRAIVAVDYAGQPCDYNRLRKIADEYGLVLISDSCHSLGATYETRDGEMAQCGSLADLSCFSFHPVKPITAGEGGIVTVNFRDNAINRSTETQLRAFRNHGIDSDHRQRQKSAQHFYDMSQLGFNYRMTDIQCALALSQLKKLDKFTAQRQKVADRYRELFQDVVEFTPLGIAENRTHANHLFVVRCHQQHGVDRDSIFRGLRKSYIGANVHYRPVYQHSYYQERFDTTQIHCPVADLAYQEILSLPLFPTITDFQVELVASTIKHLCQLANVAA